MSVDSEQVSDTGLFDALGLSERRAPGAVVATGRSLDAMNSCLVSLLSAVRSSGETATQVGAVIDSEPTWQFKRAIHGGEERVKRANPELLGEFSRLCAESGVVGSQRGGDDTEWSDAHLEKVTRFWMEQGVTIVGCGWLSGLALIKSNANLFNRGL